MKLIVGLGNPGRRYARTRHNVGFHVLDAFARKHNARIGRRMCRSLVGQAVVGEQVVVLAKPQTFMNSSGEAVGALCRRLEISAEDLIAVYDDMDLPIGRLRIRPRGSAGGHKGMNSIIAAIGSEEFVRVRIGIGREECDAIEYVLSRFGRDELPAVRDAINRAAQALECIIVEGIETAMNRFN